ncbi:MULTISPECIES: response regulator transcription factor [unclassified Sphingobium]|uniref:response regulator n=1 Tax=unclassified Sphingobium TaxID=2611147 RepID=UPI00222578CA|nr:MULTISPECIES: response regulator transcription factor [unclassified Sphingobium]
MTPTSAIVVEDQPTVRAWLSACVRSGFPEIAVTEVGTLRAARAALHESAAGFDLGLIDLGLPDGSGIELIAEIARCFPRTIAIVTTVYDDDAHLFGALGAGAGGYVLKDANDQELTASLRAIIRGQPALSPSIAQRILTHFRSDIPPLETPREILTPREIEVLAWLGRGFTARETAERLALKEQTVASYIKVIYSKLNITRRAEATLEARRRKLV